MALYYLEWCAFSSKKLSTIFNIFVESFFNLHPFYLSMHCFFHFAFSFVALELLCLCPHHMHFLVKLVPNGQHNSQCRINCHDWLLGSKFRIFNTYCFVFCAISVTLTFDFLCFQWTQSSYTLLDEIFMFIKIPLLPSPHGNIEQSST